MFIRVEGPALAGGFDLAVMCDIRVAAEGAPNSARTVSETVRHGARFR